MRNTPSPGQAERILTIPNGSPVVRIGRVLASLKDAEVSLDDERKLRLFTLSDGSIGVYRLKRYQSW